MISGDITTAIGNTFDASPYMNEIISAHVLSAASVVPLISVEGGGDGGGDVTAGFFLNLPALYCRFSGTTLSVFSRTIVDELEDEGDPVASVKEADIGRNFLITERRKVFDNRKEVN